MNGPSAGAEMTLCALESGGLITEPDARAEAASMGDA